MRKHIRFAVSFLVLTTLAAIGPAQAHAKGERAVDRAEVQDFINDMVKQHQFERDRLEALFAQVKIVPKVIESMTRPAEGLPWYKYEGIFLKPKRIKQGVEFWRQNADTLARAEREYGVPAPIIVAILGVETRYGRHKGGYRILDSLTTLAVDYPRRASFFRSELEHFLLLAREENMDPLELVGSYAGAMGKPQFIASSYRAYAVDFDGDGKRDLLNSTADAIGSVANYFKRHGWRAGEPVTYRATVKGKRYRHLVDKGLKPSLHLARWDDYGVAIEADLPPATPAALIELEQRNGREYWAGLQNFYAITRYNHSELYAMAVYQLSQAINDGYEKTKVATND